jgi:hypothetical protein
MEEDMILQPVNKEAILKKFPNQKDWSASEENVYDLKYPPAAKGRRNEKGYPKICRVCGVLLTEENEVLRPSNSRNYICKPCQANLSKAGRVNHPKRFILYRSRGNAKIRGIENTLTEADISEIPEFCPIFPWIQLRYEVGNGINEGSPALDRIDNTKGYIPGNVRLISHRANVLKSDATDQELLALGKDAEARQ